MKKNITIVFLYFVCLTAFSQASGYSVEFDGRNDFIEMEKPLKIAKSSFTIELWVKVPVPILGELSTGERVGIIFGNYTEKDPETFNFELFTKGRVRLYWRHGEVQAVGTKDLRDNQWHHVIIVRNKEQNHFVVYIDGKQDIITESAGTDTEFVTSHRIGGDRRNDNGGPSFHGQMDEIKVWTDVLTMAEAEESQKFTSIHDYSTQLKNKLLLYYQCEPGHVKGRIDDIRGDNHGMFMNF